MGLSNAMSGAIILFGMTYAMFAFASFTEIPSSINEALFERSTLDNKMANTSIELTIPNPVLVGTNFIFQIENTDLEKLWDFENFDIIVSYNDTNTNYTETLGYYSECPPSIGTWCIVTFTNDYFQPEILNTGESVDILVQVSNNLESGSILLIVVSTPNGVVATISTVV